MRKIAHYRRNNHPNSGFKERLAWQLSKGPKTGRELCALFNMSLAEFNSNIQDLLRRPGETMKVEASDPVKVGRAIDRTYTLARKPRRVLPTTRNDCCVSRKQLVNRSEEKRRQCTEAAQRRERLMKAGLYPVG
ncbi:hypothetical protein HA48_14730 [Pantoea wallisii]|uniref:Uncharacterized protein n=1 Tax=Pantoea wallisii TaxID=1076551 RepID=A0A1X1D709_9GAMM|nr:hypothetical protein [Pantoea wallisii]ORM72407.1 hypothetical protein HA48_14730 [Pantoea wallisii]